MTGDQYDIVPILVKYALHQRLTEPEERALAMWQQRSAEHAVLPVRFRERDWLAAQRKLMQRPPAEEMWTDIRQYIEASTEPVPGVVLQTRRRIGWSWYAWISRMSTWWG